MSNDIIVERFGIRLRPVTLDDDIFIYQLRTSNEIAEFIGELDSRIEVHRRWIEQYLQRSDDYYFCIELLSGERIGTISIYNIINRTGNWGRWMISPSVPAALASVWLILQVAFEHLGLDMVYSNTVLDNAKVVSFHESCGFKRIRIEPNGLTIRGKSYDMVIHSVASSDWPFIQQRLLKPATLAERLLQE